MSSRVLQLNSLILHNLNEIIIREIEVPPNSLATVTNVDVTPDLSYATVYLSILPINKQGTVLKKFNSQQKQLQYLLNKTLRLPKFPHLRFRIDDIELKNRVIERELDQLP
ncbi:MAG: ribosome-binding factor A [Candidatus Komeilibacteria bacterium CG_4_10_14_0_2_um_filter_37_10]|uniref:Ribosome-binding factor A n=1 Tax=Candidatus Komeilibacteria bacterium CG_4_10_14_0_2_um_filter_37_10 TaxID=1974470 RepID=A0A2M7VGH3_9BACT|nr:MAG: ribosome-binding factor A [Candidatus Komeilibacteria bacterium CG_4_10_14_0_2_um_filter_37_10]